MQALKEAMRVRLVYPQVLATLNVPPRTRVLLLGPPATGQTLCARVLADTEYATSWGTRRLNLFIRSGADVLSK